MLPLELIDATAAVSFDNIDIASDSRRVGKTELCKALAAYMFDTEDALVSDCQRVTKLGSHKAELRHMF